MKKIISFCLAIFMVIAVFQGSVFAEITDETVVDPRTFWKNAPAEISLNALIDMFLNVISDYSEENKNPLSYWDDFVEGFPNDNNHIIDNLKEIYIGLIEGKDPRNWIVMGDVDKDDKITASDARETLRMAVGLLDYSKDSVSFMAADIDNDNEVTASDARAILRAAVGLKEL